MKKSLSIFSMLVLLLGFASASYAISFTDTYDFEGAVLAEGPIVDIFSTNYISYSHDTPSDFEVPYDTVNSANLTISAYWVNGSNDEVQVEGTTVGTLASGGSYGDEWSWDTLSWEYVDDPSVAGFDISSAFSAWSTGDPLNITLIANGGFFDGYLELGTSTFVLDYDNGTGPAPVPEPATMLLLGTGLVGLAVTSRKKIFKKM